MTKHLFQDNLYVNFTRIANVNQRVFKELLNLYIQGILNLHLHEKKSFHLKFHIG